MAFANRFTRHLHTILLRALPLALLSSALTGELGAQNMESSSGASSAGSGLQVQISQIPTSQVQTSAQNPVFGSVPDAKVTPGVLPLTFSDAIERALRHNLAGLLSEYNTIEARGEKWQQLSDLLPNVSGDVQEVAEKESLQALGLRSGGLFGKVPAVIGPFSYFDVRASGTLRVFDWKSIQKYRASVAGESAAKFNLKDARDLVVLPICKPLPGLPGWKRRRRRSKPRSHSMIRRLHNSRPACLRPSTRSGRRWNIRRVSNNRSLRPAILPSRKFRWRG